MKKVLILSPFFSPEPISTGKYNTDLAIQLSKKNINIEVMCSHPLYPDWKPVSSDSSINGIDIKRGGSWVRYPKNNILRRFVLELWFLFFSLINIRRLRSKDAIIVILPPSCFVLATYFIKSSTKVIGIVHDLQSVHLDAKGNKLKNYLMSLIKFVEKTVFERCSYLIYLSREMKDLAKSEYKLKNNNFEVVYPSITIDKFINSGALKSFFDINYINIVYSGALGEKQNPQELYKIATELVIKNEQMRFLFFSRGAEFNRLKNLNNNKNIFFYDLVAPDHLGELLLMSDLQIVPQASGTSKGSLPSKIPNILASGSMIYSITDKNSELQDLLKLNNGCYVSNTWNIKENAKNIESFVMNKKKYNRKNQLDPFKKDYLSDLISKLI